MCTNFLLDQLRSNMTTFATRCGLICWTFWGFSSAAIGQETRLASQSLHCAAIFSVLAQSQDNNPSQAAQYAKAMDIFTGVHLQELPQPVSPSTRDSVVQKRADAAQVLRSAWLAKDAHLREEGVLCGAWAEGFLAQGERVQFVPVFPKVVAPHVRSQYQHLLNDKMGR
jgi:hypothetical protein